MLRRARQGTSAYFSVMGMIAGVWLARIPAVIGAVASQIGLHRALGIPVLLTPWIAVGAAVLAPRRGERGGGAEARARSG